MPLIFAAIWVSFIALLYAPTQTDAHFLSQSDSDLIININTVTWRHRVHLDDFLTKFKDVPENKIKEHLSNHLQVYFDSTLCGLRNIDFLSDVKGQMIYYNLNLNCPIKFNEVRVLYDQFFANPDHRHILKLNYENYLQTFSFSPQIVEFKWNKPTKGNSFEKFYKLLSDFLLKHYTGIIAAIIILITSLTLFKMSRKNK